MFLNMASVLSLISAENDAVLCDFTSNWVTVDSKNISDVVSYRTDEEEALPGTSTDASGITLTSLPGSTSDVASPCTMTVCCRIPQKVQISAVDILANARHVELLAPSGEYMTTVRGFRIDEELGLNRRLFALQHSFENPVSKFIIKFASLEVPTEVWLHSIHVTTCPVAGVAEAFPHPLGRFLSPKVDMTRVTSMLSDMKSQLQPEAAELMQNIALRQKEKIQNFENMPPMLMALMSQMQGLSMDYAGVSQHRVLPSASGAATPSDAMQQIVKNKLQEETNFQKHDSTELISASTEFCNEKSSEVVDTELPKEANLDNCGTRSGLSPEVLSGSCVHCNSLQTATLVEERLVCAINEAEKRLKEHFTSAINDMERRITERVDMALLHLIENLSATKH